jgi:hypothetical protein
MTTPRRPYRSPQRAAQIAPRRQYRSPQLADPIAPRLGYSQITPDEQFYDFDELFQGSYGGNGFTDKDDRLKKHDDYLLLEVAKLESAKRLAAEAADTLTAHADQDSEHLDNAVNAETDVVHCRIALLNQLIQGECHTPLCNRVKSSAQPGASVQYRLMECRDDRIFATQNLVAWAIPTPVLTWSWLHKLSAPHANQGVPDDVNAQLNRIVTKAIIAATRNESTEKLRDIYWKHGLRNTRLQFTNKGASREGDVSANLWQQSETQHYVTHEYEAMLASSATGDAIWIDVLWGVMQINHCEKWQNPLINAYTREAVLHAGAAAIKAMQAFYRPETRGGSQLRRAEDGMHNFLRPIIRIKHMEDLHVLTLAPYLKPDTCTVQHIVVEDGRNGILGLYDMEVKDVHPPGDTLCLPMRCFHCVGNRKNSRFNEQELNYLHSLAFQYAKNEPDAQVHARMGTTLGAPDEAEEEVKSDAPVEPAEPPAVEPDGDDDDTGYTHPFWADLLPNPTSINAKSARISFLDWDVLVSTYKWKDGSTPTTCITLVNYAPAGTRYNKNPLHGGSPEFRPRRSIVRRDLDPNRALYVKWFSRNDQVEPPEILEWNINLIDNTPDLSLTNAMRHQMGLAEERVKVFLADDGNGSTLWIDAPGMKHKFTHNLKHNMHRTNEGTVLDVYRASWREFFVPLITNNHTEGEKFALPEDSYFWVKSPQMEVKLPGNYGAFTFKNVWTDIVNNDDDMARAWERYSEARHAEDTHAGRFNAYHLSDGLGAPLKTGRGTNGPLYVGSADRLPIAPRQPPTELLERIKRLEAAKLEDARRAQNREHLLSQVLARLAPRA